MTSVRTSVILVDQDAVSRAATRRLLDEVLELEVVAEVETSKAALEVLVEIPPEATVVADWSSVDGTGIRALLTSANGDRGGCRVVVLVEDLASLSDPLEPLWAGAAALLVKDVTLPTRLGTAVQDVAAGGSVLAPQITRLLVDRLRAEAGGQEFVFDAAIASLTDRERDVLIQLAIPDQSNSDIATALQISLPTVKTHVSKILGKLGLRSRDDAARVARRQLLLSPEHPNQSISSAG